MKKFFLLLLIFTVFFKFFGQKAVEVKIHPRIEALTIFYTLATRDTLDIKPTPSVYYKDFDSYFEKYKDHQSLNWYRNLDTWDGYDLSIIGLFLSKKYPFKLEIPYEGTQLRSSNIETFLSKFNQFYKDCKVEYFIKTHQVQYAKITAYAEKSITDSKVLDDVAQFYNKPSEGKVLIFADILNNLGNNAIEIKHKPYTNTKIFKLAYLEDDNVPQTNEHEVKFTPLQNVVMHEISHLYLSDFIPIYRDQLSRRKSLFLTTASNEVLTENQWENELDELIVRVCVSKILGEKFGKERELQEIEIQAKHYKYFREVNLLFDQYVLNRKKYKSITDFYPTIVNFLEDLK